MKTAFEVVTNLATNQRTDLFREVASDGVSEGMIYDEQGLSPIGQGVRRSGPPRCLVSHSALFQITSISAFAFTW